MVTLPVDAPDFTLDMKAMHPRVQKGHRHLPTSVSQFCCAGGAYGRRLGFSGSLRSKILTASLYLSINSRPWPSKHVPGSSNQQGVHCSVMTSRASSLPWHVWKAGETVCENSLRRNVGTVEAREAKLEARSV